MTEEEKRDIKKEIQDLFAKRKQIKQEITCYNNLKQELLKKANDLGKTITSVNTHLSALNYELNTKSKGEIAKKQKEVNKQK